MFVLMDGLFTATIKLGAKQQQTERAHEFILFLLLMLPVATNTTDHK